MTTSESLRCFVALPVPSAIQKKIATFQQSLDSQVPQHSIRWTIAEQIHVTLKFLGKLDGAELPKLTTALTSAVRGHEQVQLTAECLGCFPSRKNPRVIWIGLTGDVEPLSKLQASVDEQIGEWAQKEEHRKFQAHLTIGRVRETAGRHSRRIGQILEDTQAPEFGSWIATEVLLMRSQLSPKGATHTVLERFPLAG